MFEGEKTNLFWAGLLLFGFALFATFASVWGTVSSYLNYLSYSNNSANAPYSYSYPSVWLSIVPYIVGGAIFMSIGLYMMKSGVKKNPNPPKA